MQPRPTNRWQAAMHRLPAVKHPQHDAPIILIVERGWRVAAVLAAGHGIREEPQSSSNEATIQVGTQPAGKAGVVAVGAVHLRAWLAGDGLGEAEATLRAPCSMRHAPWSKGIEFVPCAQLAGSALMYGYARVMYACRQHDKLTMPRTQHEDMIACDQPRHQSSQVNQLLQLSHSQLQHTNTPTTYQRSCIHDRQHPP